MVTGAVAGLAVTAFGNPDLFLGHGFTYFFGVSLAAIGMGIFSGARPIPWLLAGGLISHYGSSLTALVGEWNVADVNLRFILTYATYLLGAALVLKAWTVACRQTREPEQVAPVSREAVLSSAPSAV